MYRERMLGYYPNAVKSILEFNAIIDAESPEIESLSEGKDLVIADAYLPTMSERRVIQWEKTYGIQPLTQSTLEDRRNHIMARMRGQGKLNTQIINTVVSAFTGQGCKCRIEDSTLHIELLPFEETGVSVDTILANIENEIQLKIPAHLGLTVELSYVHWNEVNENNSSWGVVRATYGTWEDVLFGRSGKVNMLDTSKLDEFYLG